MDLDTRIPKSLITKIENASHEQKGLVGAFFSIHTNRQKDITRQVYVTFWVLMDSGDETRFDGGILEFPTVQCLKEAYGRISSTFLKIK